MGRKINFLISIFVNLILVLTMSIVPGIAQTNSVSKEENSSEIIEGTNKTILSEDGINKAVFFSEDVRYKEDGELIEYDPSLVKIDGDSELEKRLLKEGYISENKAGDKKQYFPSKLSEEKPILLENDKYEISFSLQNKNLNSLLGERQELSLKKEEIVTAENELVQKQLKAEYKGEKGVVEYVSENEGVKENIVFNESPITDEEKEIKFSIKVQGLELELTKSGELIYKDIETGKTKAITEKPFLNDASGKAYFDNIEVALTEKQELENKYIKSADSQSEDTQKNDGETEKEYELRYKVLGEYFEAEERVYPVTLDPSTSWGESGTSAYVFNAFPTYSYASRTLMPIGAGSGDGKSGTFRSYLKFSGVSSVLAGKSISSASLKVEQTGAGSSGQSINLYESNGVYTASGLTWNKQPDSKGSSLDNVASNGTAGTERKFIITNHMQKVANDTANASYVLKNSSLSTGYSAFHGAAASSSKRPVLSVTYIDKPATASTVGINNTHFIKGTSPTVNWTGISSSSLSAVQYRIAS
ncbi:MAG: DNRLRE domain-containing protein, partial [Anaerovoracaceae bacterium]